MLTMHTASALPQDPGAPHPEAMALLPTPPPTPEISPRHWPAGERQGQNNIVKEEVGCYWKKVSVCCRPPGQPCSSTSPPA